MHDLLKWTELVSLITLTIMEVVLSIDNIVFISIISSRLPAHKQTKARNWGLILAVIPRVILLLLINFINQWSKPLISLPGVELSEGHPLELSGRSLILLVGGIFLIYKATKEIHDKLEGAEEESATTVKKHYSFKSALIQIVLINIIFSFDSILTAVGLADSIIIMVAAVIISAGIMIVFAGVVSRVVNKHPTIKMLALAFLLMIGFLLVLEAVGLHVPKGYIYFAMAFSVTVEALNLRARKKHPVHLRDTPQVRDENLTPKNSHET
jgi:predicted tellurium resistance membrane protein TerC